MAPITLLNVDYKILAKCIAKRIEPFLPKLIHSDQTGFMKDRLIGQTVRLLNDRMEYTDVKNISGILLFIDFEKGFHAIECPFCLNPDSIEHTFLYCQESKEFFSKTLRWFNEHHQENIQLSNKQMLFNTFDDSLPLQMPISTQSKLRLLVLLQKKYLYTCKNIVTKPN